MVSVYYFYQTPCPLMKCLFQSLGLGRLLKLPQNTLAPVGVSHFYCSLFRAKQVKCVSLLHVLVLETCPTASTTTMGSVESYLSFD